MSRSRSKNPGGDRSLTDGEKRFLKTVRSRDGIPGIFKEIVDSKISRLTISFGTIPVVWNTKLKRNNAEKYFRKLGIFDEEDVGPFLEKYFFFVKMVKDEVFGKNGVLTKWFTYMENNAEGISRNGMAYLTRDLIVEYLPWLELEEEAIKKRLRVHLGPVHRGRNTPRL